MPGGEFFFSPVEDSAGGIAFSEFPAVYEGREVAEIRLRFEDGLVVEASAAPKRRSLTRYSTATRARAGWESSVSAATPASPAT